MSQYERGWYIVHTQSGHEDRVKSKLEEKVQTERLQDKIFSVMVPSEPVVEIKKNKKKVSQRKFFPGYVLVDMKVDEQTYWLVKSLSGVSGFLGEPNPARLPQQEVEAILELTTSAEGDKPKPAVIFERGENIRITDGPFRHFVGIVEDVNAAKAKIKAMVTIFGRPTPVELDFLQVEKI